MINKRHIEANRSIIFAGQQGEPPVINYIRAAQLADDDNERERMLREAAEKLAQRDDAAKQATTIIDEFIRKAKLRVDAPADSDPAPRGEAMNRIGWWWNWTKKPDEQPAPAMAPGQDDRAAKQMPQTPSTRQEDDGKLELQEVLDSIFVLREAVLQSKNMALLEVIEKGAGDAVLLAYRYRAHPNIRAQLERAANQLQQACKAWGTAAKTTPESAATDELVNEAMRKGRGASEADRITKFAREWKTLHDSGHTRMTLRRYIEINMKEGER